MFAQGSTTKCGDNFSYALAKSRINLQADKCLYRLLLVLSNPNKKGLLGLQRLLKIEAKSEYFLTFVIYRAKIRTNFNLNFSLYCAAARDCWRPRKPDASLVNSYILKPRY